MLILTDGQETQPPFINDVLPKVKDAGVIVNILSFSPDPADDLAQASSETGTNRAAHFIFTQICNIRQFNDSSGRVWLSVS